MSQPPFAIPLRIPGREGLLATLSPGEPVILTAAYRQVPLFGGRRTDMMVYESRVGGRELLNPTIVARRGDIIDATLVNALGEDTTIHWHGLHVDEKNDGGGMVPVKHQERYGYRFRVANRPGLYWYHPHPHHRAGLQVHQGLAGLFIVEGEEDDALRRSLDLVPGDNEIPLLLQDKQVDERNKLKYSLGEDEWIGNRAMVNWTPEPVLNASARLYRFRIVNGANARLFRLAFVQGRRRLPFHLIGTDGGFLDRPRRATEVFLANAQRVDLLLDLSSVRTGSTVMMKSLRFDPMENEHGHNHMDPALEHPGAAPMGDPMDLMRIDVTARGPRARPMPARLGPALPVLRANGPRRKFVLSARDGRWLVNGRNFFDDMRRVDFTARGGDVETWEIHNVVASMPHPMHVHGFHFRVLSRRGSPPQVRRLSVAPGVLSPQDLGWQDTVEVWPGETVVVAVDFSPALPGVNHYMFHCHNLEHEDQGMMLNFAVDRDRR